MLDDMPNEWYMGWVQFHQQFNLAFNRDDLHWGIMIADFRNAHRDEGSPATTAAEVMPYFDQYADDDAFIANLRAFAAQHHKG